MAITALVAASWWVNYELSPVASTTSTFLPMFLLVLLSRVILGFAFCGSCAGIGMGSVAMSMLCFRLLSQIGFPVFSARYSRRCLVSIAASIVFIATYGGGFVCIGDTGFFADFVMFMGLQISEFFMIRRFINWRVAKEMTRCDSS